MKKSLVVLLVLGCVAGSFGEKIISANRMNLRPGEKAVFWGWQANGPSEGVIAPAPGYDWPTEQVSEETIELRLRWSGLTLDNKGQGDDYIEFTLQAAGKSGEFSSGVFWNGLGWGVDGGMYGIGDGESMTFVITDVISNVGVASFEGFSSCSIQTAYERKTTGIAKANGVELKAEDADGTISLPKDSFAPDKTLSLETVTVNEGFFARDFDLVFSHSIPKKETLGFLCSF